MDELSDILGVIDSVGSSAHRIFNSPEFEEVSLLSTHALGDFDYSQIGIIVMAGGESTSFRRHRRSGRWRCPIGPISGKGLLEWQFEKIRWLRKSTGANFPTLVVCNPPEKSEMIRAIRNCDASSFTYVEAQTELPLVDDSRRIIEPKRYAPTGHGGFLQCWREISKKKVFQQVKTVYSLQLPNVLEPICHPRLLELHRQRGREMTILSFAEYDRSQPLGRFFDDNGKTGFLEYHDFEFLENTESIAQLPANAGTCIYETSFLARMGNVLKPKLVKHRDPESGIIANKIEYLAYDLVSHARTVNLLLLDRNEFYSKVKYAFGDSSCDSARRDILKYCSALVSAHGGNSELSRAVELSPGAMTGVGLNFDTSLIREEEGLVEFDLETARVREHKVSEVFVRNSLISQSNRSGPSENVSLSLHEMDDCAVIRATSANPELAVSSDYIRGHQFDLYQKGYLNHYDLGYYLVVANVSDLAACGAEPLGFNFIFRYPPGFGKPECLDVIQGVNDALEEYSCALLGGDSGGATSLILAGTAIGKIAKRILRRTSPVPGDTVYVAGYPGRAKCAQLLSELARDRKLDQEGFKLFEECLMAWRRPTAQVELGRTLAELHDREICCLDSSDGLYESCLLMLGESTQLCIVVSLSEIPVQWSYTSEAARYLGKDVWQMLFSPGPDFCLVFSSSAILDDDLIRQFGVVKLGYVDDRVGRGPVCRLVAGESMNVEADLYRQ